MSGAIDRVDGALAVVVSASGAGDEAGLSEWVVDRRWLPRGAVEGDLVVLGVLMPDARARLERRLEGLQDQFLNHTPGGAVADEK